MSEQQGQDGTVSSQQFELDELTKRLRQSDDSYLEFLRVPAVSAGLYTLPQGGIDPQNPHHEDEVYVVLEGRAVLQVEAEDRPVAKGSVAFVAAEVPHRFHTIAEDLVVLVLFAPAETP